MKKSGCPKQGDGGPQSLLNGTGAVLPEAREQKCLVNFMARTDSQAPARSNGFLLVWC